MKRLFGKNGPLVNFTIIVILIFVQTLRAQNKVDYILKDSLQPYILVLGIAQDAGYPQIGCQRSCCIDSWRQACTQTWVSSIAVVDPAVNKWWLIDATPDLKQQLHEFNKLTEGKFPYLPDMIFLTHAHTGHYIGLLQFGREAMNTKDLIIVAMPRMLELLKTQAPWSQLTLLKNIDLRNMTLTKKYTLSDRVSILPLEVPHRDEFSETVGFKVTCGAKNYLFIPDIDKWNKWEMNVVEEVKKIDFAFLDGTFYDESELAFRKIGEVPHPTVRETMALFAAEPDSVKNKIHFIHLNHTNPLIWSDERKEEIEKKGYHTAIQGKLY
ncbi:MAG: pyrroloquinoline quinone biosynthesis protein PqqB [Saprospiraceae bacterium]|nr:pyrroloquinoline quinone biosynthesis protein PqqB [Saprospiraceae bacterium]